MADELELMTGLYSSTLSQLHLSKLSAQKCWDRVVEQEKQIVSMEITQELELSNLQTKIRLLEQTLTQKNKDFTMLESLKSNNEQLLDLLEKYDEKVNEL